MRWPSYFIFAYFMLGLQVGVSRYLAWHGAAPNLGLLAVLFIALNAPRDAALMGSFAIGFLQDILTQQQPGLFAFSYGLFAMMLVAAHQMLNRTHPLTHFFAAMLGGFVTAVVVLIHGWIHPAATAVLVDAKTALKPLRVPVSIEFLRVLVTAVAAPVLLMGLQRIRGVFAFQAVRRRTNWG